MTDTPKNANERLIRRIDAALPSIPRDADSRRVLTYIRGQITPEGIEARPEWDKSVTHLHEVATSHLNRYKPKEAISA